MSLLQFSEAEVAFLSAGVEDDDELPSEMTTEEAQAWLDRNKVTMNRIAIRMLQDMISPVNPLSLN